MEIEIVVTALVAGLFILCAVVVARDRKKPPADPRKKFGSIDGGLKRRKRDEEN